MTDSKRTSPRLLYGVYAAIGVLVLVGSIALARYVRTMREPYQIRYFDCEGNQCLEIVDTDTEDSVRGKAVIHTKHQFQSSGTFLMDREQELPLGEITFHDFTILPGRVTLKIDGHEIDVFSGAVRVDGKAWKFDDMPKIPLEE